MKLKEIDKQTLRAERKKAELWDYVICGQKAPEWLDIFYKGRMVEINGKGKIRPKRRKK